MPVLKCLAGAQVVLGWCSNCARVVLKLCSAGAQIVLGWCSNCARLVLKLCSAGAQIVLRLVLKLCFGWCSNCAFLVVPLVLVLSSLWTFPCPGFFFPFFGQLFLRSPCAFFVLFFFLVFFGAFLIFFLVFFLCFLALFLCLLVLVLAVGTYAAMKFCDLGFGWAQGLGFKV